MVGGYKPTHMTRNHHLADIVLCLGPQDIGTWQKKVCCLTIYIYTYYIYTYIYTVFIYLFTFIYLYIYIYNIHIWSRRWQPVMISYKNSLDASHKSGNRWDFQRLGTHLPAAGQPGFAEAAMAAKIGHKTRSSGYCHPGHGDPGISSSFCKIASTFAIYVDQVMELIEVWPSIQRTLCHCGA